jgi:hypothetical protein
MWLPGFLLPWLPGILFGPHPCNSLCLGREPKARVATICICILYVIWVSGSPFLVKQNQFSFKESYEALTHQKHHTWKSQKEWRRSTCAMTVFVTFVLLLFHIVQLYNHEWHDDSHSSSKKWCHNWVNFTTTPHPAISSLGTHTTSEVKTSLLNNHQNNSLLVLLCCFLHGNERFGG